MFLLNAGAACNWSCASPAHAVDAHTCMFLHVCLRVFLDERVCQARRPDSCVAMPSAPSRVLLSARASATLVLLGAPALLLPACNPETVHVGLLLPRMHTYVVCTVMIYPEAAPG